MILNFCEKKAVGGYFELELGCGEHYHKGALGLNTGRNCLEYILKVRQYTKIFIPYYTCETVLEPIKNSNIQYEYYNINLQLEPVKKYNISDRDAFLYTNYFGLKQELVIYLSNYYGTNLIIDNSQAFFAEPQQGIDTFYSARKFFGVPDGAYLYTNENSDVKIENDVSYMRMSHLLKRADIGAEAGYNDFKQNDNALKNQPIKKMSNLTDKLLRSIDYEDIKHRRRENFQLLDKLLSDSNKIKLALGENDVPMVYPYLSADRNLRNKLIDNKVFVAEYWENVLEWCKSGFPEYELTEYLLLLPIDHRYSKDEMLRIVSLIKRKSRGKYV